MSSMGELTLKAFTFIYVLYFKLNLNMFSSFLAVKQRASFKAKKK